MTDEPTNASALLHDGAGSYLLHLRDHLPGEISEPGRWALLGGEREPVDGSLEETVRRELWEEAGLDVPVLTPYAVESAPGLDGLPRPVRVFSGRWSGDPASLPLTEGVMLHWWRPEEMRVLHMSPSLRELVQRHALRSRGGQEPGRPGRPGVPHKPYEPYEPRVGEARAAASVPLWETIALLARRFDAHDEARGLEPGQQWVLQALKVAEESGEVAEAVIGACGTNPRKGDSHSWQDVHAELADVAVTSLVALARMRPGNTEAYLRSQLAEKSAKFLPPYDGETLTETV